MAKPNAVSDPVALMLVRKLSGSPGYPFHAEGESRFADVLIECSISVEHATAVIDEFEADFPTIEQLRAVAFRLRSKFDPEAKRKEAEARRRDEEDRKAISNLRQSVPLIPGVRWEVCLQIQCLRIAISEAFKDQEYYLKCCKEFPEAMGDLRDKKDPDPKIVEKRLLSRNPGWARHGMGALSQLDDITRRTVNDAADAERSANQQ